MTAPEVPRLASKEGPAEFLPIEGVRETSVRHLSARGAEPEWMLRLRLRGLGQLRSEGVPAWASFLAEVDFDGMVRSDDPAKTAQRSMPADDAGSAGSGSLDASEEGYRTLRQDLLSLGVRFDGLSSTVAGNGDLVRTHLASVVPPDDSPLAALNAALSTGGSFLYVPPDVTVPVPLQAEIRQDYSGVEPFERNLIVADRGAQVTFIEGCTAPVYMPERLHVSTIEVVAMPDARVRYIALQNFSKQVDNLVTKRAQVHAGASVEWVDLNLGARRSWKVPRANLIGPGAAAEFIGVALVGQGQSEEAGAEMVHLAPHTRSRIANHAIVHRGGRAALRSGVQVAAGATDAASSIEWSSLMLDSESRAQTVPSIEVDEADAEITQSGTVRKVGEEMFFYMSSRGVTADEAIRMVVLGIASVATRRIPVEYAVEADRLIELELGGAVG
jgi:Fe-S cluster assembly protein SufB